MCSSRCLTIRPRRNTCLSAAGKKKPPGEIVEEVARRKLLLQELPVKRSLAFHPRAPRLISLRLLRDLYLMDLVQVAILPGVSAELKRSAEDQLLARLPHFLSGRNHIGAARPGARGRRAARGRSRSIISIVLDNPYMTKRKSESALPRKASHFRDSGHRSSSQMVHQRTMSASHWSATLLHRSPRFFPTFRAHGFRSAGIGGPGHRSGKPPQISAGRSAAPHARQRKTASGNGPPRTLPRPIGSRHRFFHS